jgi:peptide/nickel transport system ATP-binding protein
VSVPVAELCGVHRRYGASAVIAGVDLTVGAGEIVGIAGPSGSGKSTLLRLLAALEPPDRGAVLLGAAPAWGGSRRRPRRRVPRPGYVQQVFQDPVGALDARWPLWRTITEPLTVTGPVRRPRRRQLAEDALARVGLHDVPIDARPAELSVGQSQRVAVLRALAAQPALLLADEPTSALDSVSTAGILDLLRAAAAAGTAIVLVSHDPRVLTATAHRVLRLRDGRLDPAAPSGAS